MSLSDSEGSETVLVGPGDIRDFNEENILPLPADELQKITDWLQPTPYDLERSDFSRHLASYLQGTGQWLTSTSTYQQWHQGGENEDGLLWIKGIPGSGKSVMAASIIHQLRKEEVPVLYFFFRQIIDANHQPAAALRDWLCQALPFSPPLQVRLRDEYLEKKRPIDSLAPSDLLKDLKFALSAFPKVYCVTDALDEMDQGNDEFLRSLAQLGQWRPANVKVLITSRPVVAVESPLRPFHIRHIRLDENFVDIDIAAYVQHRLRDSVVPHEYWSVVTEAVPGRANGLFLYAKLSMDAFMSGDNPQAVIEKLPLDLNVMYSNLLREHAKRSDIPDEFQLLILQFVTHATRPLRLLEIAEMAKATHDPFKDYSLKEIKDLVRAACGPLIQVLYDETVSVIHHSFTEFLKGFTRKIPLDDSTYPILEAGPTNHRLAIACMDYLTSGCLDKLEIKTRSNDDFFQPKKAQQSETRLQFPFLEYAAANWYIHTRRATFAGEDVSSFFKTLDDFVANNQRFLSWLDIDWPENQIQGLTPLHAAACTGLCQYARHLLQEKHADPNAKSNCDDSPLYWAALSGHADVAQVLIDNGADPDGEANEGYKPLHKAASHNHAEVVKVLLAAGVNPLTEKTGEAPGRRCGNAPRSIGNTPWMYACKNGQKEAVAELLPYITDHGDLEWALFWSTEAGHAACVDLILQQPGMNVNSKLIGDTPLFRACCVNDMSTIKVLLKAGADPNILCEHNSIRFGGRPFHEDQRYGDHRQNVEPRGYTALHALCGIKKGNKRTGDCVPLLLEAGANIHSKCPDGRTALHLACSNNIEAVMMLLEAGADPNTETDDGSTILHTDGSTDKVLLPILLKSGLIDVNELMKKGRTSPLHLRLQRHNLQSVLEFLKFKPDLNLADLDGNRPLHVLLKEFTFKVSKSTCDIVDTLLSAGANPNLQNGKGETPLHLMQNSSNFETVSRFVKAGVDLEIRDLEGQTALFKNVESDSNGEPTYSNAFIELGARLDTRDNKGRTLLHQVVGNTRRLDNLIARIDIDPSVVDNKGNTLFHEATSKRYNFDKLPIYIHLMKLGVNIDQPNNHGKTVLHKICARESRLSSWNPFRKNAFDYVIQACKNLNPRDIDGVQPLHVAAVVSEDYVFKLLDAGADPFGTTNEGMTVLHVASRARQPGIIGLVLSRLKEQEDVTFKAFINQKNVEGNTALHYACCAGHPESVDLLLDAGADPNLPGRDGYTPLRACADFEVEQSRWSRIVEIDDDKGESRKSTKTGRAGSIFLDDHNLALTAEHLKDYNWRQHGLTKESHSTRLDEILVSLVLHGAKLTGNDNSLRDAFHTAVLNQRDYTAECLLRLQSRSLPNMNLLEGPDGEAFIASKSRLESERSSLRQEDSKNNNRKTQDGHCRQLQPFYPAKLLGLRQYEMLEVRILQTDVLELYQTNKFLSISLLHTLASFGLSDLLRRVCTREIALRFDDNDWCEQAQIANRVPKIQPLLTVACNRRIPNMTVVRFLIEEMGVSIGANCRQRVFIDNGKRREFVSGNSVLHQISEGQAWWNVHQALPYLIQKGADLEVRNRSGETPLHIALDEKRFKGVFYKEAVQILLDGGADTNAVDNHGDSCLSKAGTDTGLIKLLLSYGARVSPAAVFSAIELQQVELLELFLARGEMANQRRPASENPKKLSRHETSGILNSESYPLYHAAFYHKPDYRVNEDDRTPSQMRMMTALLRHGADPYSTFVMRYRVDDMDDAGSEDDQEPEWEFETCTIIHEILQRGMVAEPLFDLPSLQLETRDAEGQTLLLAASRGGHIKRVEDLLARGADVMAQDQEGKTVVHNLMNNEPNETTFKCLKTIFNQKPDLVHIPDNVGDTPLHYVLKGTHNNVNHIDLLLEHGADPLQPDSNGNTALHFFARNPLTFKSRIEQFQGLGVDINARNKKGDPPLFEYITHGQLSWVLCQNKEHENLDNVHHLRYFKEAGADFFARNHAGSSLLHVLAGRKLGGRIFGHNEKQYELPIENLVNWFKFLVGMNLDPMLEDARQRTCLDVAAACGNEHILKLFQQTPEHEALNRSD